LIGALTLHTSDKMDMLIQDGNNPLPLHCGCEEKQEPVVESKQTPIFVLEIYYLSIRALCSEIQNYLV